MARRRLRLDDPLACGLSSCLFGVLDEIERAERLTRPQPRHHLQVRQQQSHCLIAGFGHHALTVMNVIGSDARSLGRNSERYTASASSVPCPEKWWANTYGSPLAAARCAEYIDEPSSHSRGSVAAAGVALRT